VLQVRDPRTPDFRTKSKREKRKRERERKKERKKEREIRQPCGGKIQSEIAFHP